MTGSGDWACAPTSEINRTATNPHRVARAEKSLRDHKRAKLVGEKSYGKGSVQLVYDLNDQSSLHVTNAQWFTPNHHQLTGNGLVPDVPVPTGSDPLPVAINELN